MGDDAPRAEDRLLPSRRFLIAWTAVVVLLAAAAWLLLPRWSWYMRSRTARAERGVVTAVEHQGSMDRVTVSCPSGPVTLEDERPSSIFAPQAVDEGDRVLVRFGADGPSLGPKVRDRTLLAVTALFFIVLAVAGGKRALRTALSLVAAFLLLVLVLAPLTLAGWNPLLVGLGIRVADLAFVRHADLHQLGRTPWVALLMCQPEVPGVIRFPLPVPDLAGDDQRLLVVVDGPLRLPEATVGDPQVAQGSPLPPAVADLAVDGQRPLVVVDGTQGLPQTEVGGPQVAQVGSLSPAVPNLARDGQRLLVVLDGSPRLPQARVGQPQVAQASPLPPAVPYLLGDLQ